MDEIEMEKVINPTENLVSFNEYTPQSPTWVFFEMYLPFLLRTQTAYSYVFGDWQEVTHRQLHI